MTKDKQKMNARERAERIWDDIVFSSKHDLPIIERGILAYEAEARKQAFEEAARIAEAESCSDHHIGVAGCLDEHGKHRTQYCPKAIAAAIREKAK